MDIGPMISRNLVVVGPAHSLREAAVMMRDRNVGSAVVLSEDGAPGILTERDVLRAVADGADPDTTTVDAYMTANAVTASPTWSAEEAGRVMIERGFRHLVVVGEGGRVEGVLSIRDLFAHLAGRTAGTA